MRVVLIGVGALGSNLLFCARSIEGLEWVLVDMDRVEFKNTQAQFHTVQSIGKNKAEAMKRTAFALFKLRVEAKPVELKANNIEQLLFGADLVIDCLDNAYTRKLVKHWTERTGTPCLHGGLAEDGEFGLVRWDEQFVVDEETAAGQATCEAGEHTPFIMLVSSVMAVALQEFVLNGSRLNFNAAPYLTTRC